MRLSFQQRTAEQADYISISQEENEYRNYFQYEFGFGEIKPVYTAHLEKILPEEKGPAIDLYYVFRSDVVLTKIQKRFFEILSS